MQQHAPMKLVIVRTWFHAVHVEKYRTRPDHSPPGRVRGLNSPNPVHGVEMC